MEYFYATANANGDLAFGPLYELLPFMLVRDTLAQAPVVPVVDIPQTGESATMAGWLMLAVAGLAGCAWLMYRRKRCN